MGMLSRSRPDIRARRVAYGALERALAGQTRASAAETRALLALDSEDAIVWMVAGVLLFALRAYDKSMLAFDRAVVSGGGGRALALKHDRASRLGRIDVANVALSGWALYDPHAHATAASRGATHDPHARDREDLLDAAGLLRGRLGARRGGPMPTVTPTTLTTTELDQFMVHGYVCLRGAVPPETMHTWVQGAEARLSAAVAASGRAPFAIHDRATWPEDVVSCPGQSLAPAASVAPKLWGAICDLLGGRARVKTTMISDYFVVRFPRGAASQFDDDLGLSWHIDDPSRVTSAKSIGTGVIALALGSHVARGGGETWLLPESVAHVTHALASRDGHEPIDVDLVSRVAARCTEVVHCTGMPGDVYLVHPLMVHSGSRNRSDRIRWLANWMFNPAAPLDSHRADEASPCPVECVMKRSLARAT